MKLSNIAKKTIVTILIMMLILIAGGVLFYRSLSSLPFIFGVILGSTASIIKVVMLEAAVDKALTMDKKAAGNFLQLQHLLRLLLTGAVLLLSVLLPFINLWGTTASIFTFQLSLFFLKLSTKT